MNDERGEGPRCPIDVDILRKLFNFVVYMLQQGVDRVWAAAIQLTWGFPLLLALSLGWRRRKGERQRKSKSKNASRRQPTASGGR